MSMQSALMSFCEGQLKVPAKQPKRKRLWFNDGSCVRLRPEYKNHVWSYDFVMCRGHDGRAIKMLTIIDEYPRALCDFIFHCNAMC